MHGRKNKENCALKLVDEIILYYEARSKKHQMTQIPCSITIHFVPLVLQQSASLIPPFYVLLQFYIFVSTFLPYLYFPLVAASYSVIQKDGLNFLHLHFLNYTRYVDDLHNI